MIQKGSENVYKELHDEELSNLYSSSSIIRVIKIKEYEMGRACSTHGGD
jgi:hypothetical protein